MNALIYILGILVTFSAFADNGYDGGRFSFGGLGFALHTSDNQGKENSAGAAFATEGEGLVLGTFSSGKQKHFVILDSKILAFVGGGVEKQGSNGVEPMFRLKFIGNLSGGIQIFRFVPITPSLEDFVWDIHGGKKVKKSLSGATVYIPISVSDTARRHGLFLGTTIGYRSNNEITPSTAIQPKLRYVGDRFSGEVRYLRNFGNKTATENRAVGQFDLNNVLTDSDHLGLMIEYDSLNFKDEAVRDSNGINGLVYYGLELE